MVSQSALNCLVNRISPQLMQRLQLTSAGTESGFCCGDQSGWWWEMVAASLKNKTTLKLSWQRAVKMGQSGQVCFCFSLPTPEKNPISPLRFSRSSSLCCPGRALAATHIFTNKYRSPVLATASFTRDAAHWSFLKFVCWNSVDTSDIFAGSRTNHHHSVTCDVY